MQLCTLILGLALISSVTSISHYDFNACRISNCNAEELNCISDEKGCLDMFGAMRACFKTCTGVYDNYNPCWKTCKDQGSTSNTYWYSMSLCYQNICYVYEKWMILGMTLMLLLALL